MTPMVARFVGQQHGARTGARRGRRGLAAGMAAADNDDIRVRGIQGLHKRRHCTAGRGVKNGGQDDGPPPAGPGHRPPPCFT